MNGAIIVQVVCGISLLLVLVALIFSEKFRKDCLSKGNTAKFLGILSVEGAIVVVLCSLFIAGLIFPVFKDISKKDKTLTTQKKEIERLKNDLTEKDGEIKRLETTINTQKTDNDLTTQTIDRLENDLTEKVGEIKRLKNKIGSIVICPKGNCIKKNGECGEIRLIVGTSDLRQTTHSNEKEHNPKEGINVYSIYLDAQYAYAYATWSCE